MVALPILALPVMTVLLALLQLQLLELVLWVPLRLHESWVRLRRGQPDKQVVFPRLELRLAGRGAAECPPSGWDRSLRP